MPKNKDSTSRRGSGFVVDGNERLADGVRAVVKLEVEAEFSEQLANSTWLQRLRLRRQMRSEIERRVAKEMPSENALW
jgi:hypothetical protein